MPRLLSKNIKMLLSSIKKLSKDSIIYGISGGITQLIGLILLPILTRIFTPSDYGVIDIITTFISIIMVFLMLGLNSATQRLYFDSDDETYKQKIVSTSFWFLIIFTIICSLLLYFFSNQISLMLFNDYEYSNLIKLAIITLPLTSILVFGKDNLRLLFSPWKYNFLTLGNTLIRVILVIYLVIVLKRGLEGNFEAAIYAGIIGALYAIYLSRKLIRKYFSFDLLKKLLTYGIPLTFAGLAYWVISFSDRLILVKLSNLEEVGLYSVGNRISSALMLITSAFSLAWSPFIFALHKEGKEKNIIIKTLTYYTLLLLFLSLLISIFSPELLLIITTSDYLDASQVVGYLTIGLSILGLSSILATGLTLVKKTKYITISSIIAACLNILFNFILIPYYGMKGAAIATLISYVSLCILYYYFSNKFYKIKYDTIKIIKILSIFALFIYFGSIINIENIYKSISLKLILIIISIIFLFIFKIFDKNEINFIKKIINKFIKK
ncbi:MAG: flippase [bacterium]|nr:flippase [bacterium]